MPFTPVHLGPGLLVKGALGHRFSFMVFGGTQVLMDIEPLLGILLGWDILHGPTHTFLGATGIALLATLTGRPISNLVLTWLRIAHHPITWRVSAVSALIAAWSHVALDAIMHWDSLPFSPFWQFNPWYQAITTPQLHVACVLAGVAGLALCHWRRLPFRNSDSARL